MDKKKRLITMVVTLLVLTIGVTFAYFMAKTGEGKQAGTTITTGTVDALKFNVSKENLSLNINQFNFASGSGNLSDNVTATASLKANSTKNTATYNYYVYFQIESNDYVYTTTDKKPEIVLSITGPNGEITSVDGLTYVSATNADGTVVKGFDITESKPSVVKIADSFEISSSSSTNYTNQEWTFTVTFINLDTNQVDNQNKNLTGKVLIQQEKIYFSGELIASKFTGTQGDGGLYYHNGTITDTSGNVIDASDNSYRYSGANPDNYVCISSEETTCSEDNLYRIIGVFEENNHGVAGQKMVKMIKNSSIGGIAWNLTYPSNDSNNWSKSSLNTFLNTTFLSNSLSDIADKLATVAWKISGSSYVDTAKAVHLTEITNAKETYSGKIGLMYASDYGFATDIEYWTTKLGYYETASKNDWLFLNVYEWLLTPLASDYYSSWVIGNHGAVYNGDIVTNTNAVRPCFYLKSDVSFSSGSGTSTDPYRIN